jgi:hypothetical protein
MKSGDRVIVNKPGQVVGTLGDYARVTFNDGDNDVWINQNDLELAPIEEPPVHSVVVVEQNGYYTPFKRYPDGWAITGEESEIEWHYISGLGNIVQVYSGPESF